LYPQPETAMHRYATHLRSSHTYCVGVVDNDLQYEHTRIVLLLSICNWFPLYCCLDWDEFHTNFHENWSQCVQNSVNHCHASTSDTISYYFPVSVVMGRIVNSVWCISYSGYCETGPWNTPLWRIRKIRRG